MSKITTNMEQTISSNGEEIKVNITFEPNVLAQLCYYKGIDVSEYIDFETSPKEKLAELVQEMSKLLIEVGEDYRNSRN